MILNPSTDEDVESLKRRLIAEGYDIIVLGENVMIALPNPRSAKTGKMHKPARFPGNGKSRSGI